VVFTSGIETILDPRVYFRNIWKLLKPGGTCFIFVSDLPVPGVDRTFKMWSNMNNEQKMWIAGSYYHYSVEQGWESTEGYDVNLGGISGNVTDPSQLVFAKVEGVDPIYAVKANKIAYADVGDAETTSIDGYLMNEMLGYNHFETDDRLFLSLRLGTSPTPKVWSSKEISTLKTVTIPRLSDIYSILKQVSSSLIPPSIKAILATYIVSQWDSTPSQTLALRRGLGVDPVDAEFWGPIGKLTAAIAPKDKVCQTKAS